MSFQQMTIRMNEHDVFVFSVVTVRLERDDNPVTNDTRSGTHRQRTW